MAKKKSKNITTKIDVVTLVFGILMGLLALPIISLFPAKGNLSFFQYMGYLFIYCIVVRLSIYFFQKALIKKVGINYHGDDIDKRFFSNVLYTITLLLVLTLIIHFANDDGWISSILAGVLLTVPAFIVNIMAHGEASNDSKEINSRAVNKEKTKSSNSLFSDYSRSGNFGNQNYYHKDGTLKGFAKIDNFGNTVYYDKNGSQNKDIAYSKKGNSGETIYYKKDGTISDDVAYSKKGNFGETIYYRKDGTIKGTSRKSNLGNEIYQKK